MGTVKKARDILINIANKYHNDWHLVFSCLEQRDAPEEEYDWKPFGDSVVTILDADYSGLVKHNCTYPPFVIFYKGDISAFNRSDYYFVVGDNVFDIADKDIIRYNHNSKTIMIGGVLEMYVDERGLDVMRMATSMSKGLIMTKDVENRTYVSVIVSYALLHGKTVATTLPKDANSLNAKLLTEGAVLLRNKDDFDFEFNKGYGI